MTATQNKKIEIKCFGFQILELDYFTEFQGDLKVLSDEALKQIKAQILELGFSEPISVWQHEGSNFILNGHQRIKALKSFRDEGYSIPPIPINVVEADDFDQAKKKVLALASQYGEVSNEGYARYLSENNIDIRYARDNYRMPEVDYNEVEQRYSRPEKSDEKNELTNAGQDSNINMRDKFLYPPFSILSARDGGWQNRKREWISIGIQSELGRGGELSASYKSQEKLSALRRQTKTPCMKG